jgi:hypothetical protein
LHGQELKVALESISTYWESMPTVDSVLSLVPFESAPNLDDFLRLFQGPVDVDLESERVWPMAQVDEIK